MVHNDGKHEDAQKQTTASAHADGIKDNPGTGTVTRLLRPLIVGTAKCTWLRLIKLTMFVALLMSFSSSLVFASDGADMTRARIEISDEGYRLSAAFSFELNRGLEDAIQRGVPLYFTTEVELTRPRWYWFDEKAINASQTIRLSYNVLTRRYHAAINGNLQQSFDSLEDALSLIRRPSRWIIAEKGALQTGEIYKVAVRMGLDLAQLPKPFQVNALNNSDWRLSSDWKTFNYKAE
ncbi:hypothetical protein HNR39_002073 [Glaciimonas immobilis]|uniref:DUF4390 domain-containing protein n=2 Tax=Glaciimonas immobilis TaxID=728004 RepID=A0A840RT78_9BURK|nr:hypothetical protein [Glaciimonas immobilis]